MRFIRVSVRIVIFLSLVISLSFLFISKSKLDPIPFTLKEGEVKCEKKNDCLDKAKNIFSQKISEQLQVKKDSFKRVNAIFTDFALIPLEYKVELENTSYVRVYITGTNQTQNITKVYLTCSFDDIPTRMEYLGRITIFKNLELNNFQTDILNKFDGCVLSSGGVEAEIKGWSWPSGEFLQMSLNRSFKVFPTLTKMSIFLIILKSLILSLLVLPILKQGGLFFKNGTSYFIKD